jgi:alpha-D-ribose 1-methylphosphonate 5-triphosphate synthase subunit PhnH
MTNTNAEVGEVAFSAFENELLAFPVSDENRQFKALLEAYSNAGIYAEGSQSSHGYSVMRTALRSEILKLASSMGYALGVE